MARPEVGWIFDACNSTAGFNHHDALFEKPLAPARPNDGLPRRLVHRSIALNLFFEPSLPNVQIVACRNSSILDRRDSWGTVNQGACLLSNQPSEYPCEVLREFRQIDRLDAVSVGLER